MLLLFKWLLLVSPVFTQGYRNRLNPDFKLFDAPPGLSINSTTCSPLQAQAITETIQLIRTLSAGGLAAARQESSPIFLFFFREYEKPYVQNAFSNISAIVSGKGPSIVVHCVDLFATCTALTVAYLSVPPSGQEHLIRQQVLVVCPQFFDLPLMIDPCDRTSLESAIVTWHGRGGQFGACKVLSILHELLHVRTLASPTVKHLRDVIPYASLAHEHKLGNVPSIPLAERIYEKWQPHQNIYAYQLMAAWVWMSLEQKRRCPNNYRLWGILEAVGSRRIKAILPKIPINHGLGREELKRKLLVNLLEESKEYSGEARGGQHLFLD